tara:strand:- start:2021 stop:2686 length:666 start_codon:yes stop_codon:yes gene_type:complete
MNKFNGQAEQDKFILNILNFKKNGYFIEIGSNHPVSINNTYLLEKDYNWKGIMIEYSNKWLNGYKQLRQNSIHIINDATKIDYKKMFQNNDVPNNIDYLQIDLEPANGSTLATLKKIDNEVMDNHKFATITFEHDCRKDLYHLDIIQKTRIESRKILKERGYFCLFEDIHNFHPDYTYEDWYVHPELVNMDYVRLLKNKNLKNYTENSYLGKSINWKDIIY